jgi:hypothetical protein
MVQTTFYATDYTEKSPYWTFFIDPLMRVFAHLDYFRIARYSPTKPESGSLTGLRQSSLSALAI